MRPRPLSRPLPSRALVPLLALALRTMSALALLGAASVGCFTLKGDAPPAEQTYVLDWDGGDADAPSDGSRGCYVLRVAEPDAAPGLATARMAYVREPHHMQYFAESRWVDAPGRMMLPLLVRALAARGPFRLVVPQTTPVADADLLLQSQVLELVQVFGDDGSEAVVALSATLMTADGRRVLARETFRAREPAPHDDPYGGVIAANRAFDRVLAALTAHVRERLAGDGAPRCHEP